MLRRLTSYARSSSSGSAITEKPQSSRPKPTEVNTPCMTLAFSKIARGDSAGLMSEIAKAAVSECGSENVRESTLTIDVFPQLCHAVFSFGCAHALK